MGEIPAGAINKLQLVQNSAARLLTVIRKHGHISPILRSLYWLPIPERIDFKHRLLEQALHSLFPFSLPPSLPFLRLPRRLTFKSRIDVAPPYKEELLVRYRPTRILRSADKGLLVQTKYNLKTYGFRAFSHAAPKI